MITVDAKNTMLGALPGTVYAALFSGGAPGTGTEVAPATLWGSGDRPAVALAAAAGGERAPAEDTLLGTIAAPATVTHVGWYSAATGGTLLGFAAHARSYAATDIVSVPAANPVFAIED